MPLDVAESKFNDYSLERNPNGEKLVPGSTPEETLNGAWGKKKAPLTMLTEFLKLVPLDEKVDECINLAHEILEYEPQNSIIKQFVVTLTEKKEAMKNGPLEDLVQVDSSTEEDTDDDEGTESEEDSDESYDDENDAKGVDKEDYSSAEGKEYYSDSKCAK